ncbi:MAG: hypothetical protein LBM73_00940 [Candidatus Nomurabacteria bacterium]|jgi:hypothetical protein|nr:hypothetical protein [Candidatus Nomurabacteria bacterium]
MSLREINFTNPDICPHCPRIAGGGLSCCQSGACTYSADDIFCASDPEVYTSELLYSSKATITASPDDDGFLLWLRSREVGESGINLVPIKSAACALLGESGCALSFDDRPFGGKILIPDADGVCRNNPSLSRQLWESWDKKQADFREIFRNVVGQSAEAVLDQQIDRAKRSLSLWWNYCREHDFLVDRKITNRARALYVLLKSYGVDANSSLCEKSA